MARKNQDKEKEYNGGLEGLWSTKGSVESWVSERLGRKCTSKEVGHFRLAVSQFNKGMKKWASMGKENVFLERLIAFLKEGGADINEEAFRDEWGKAMLEEVERRAKKHKQRGSER